MAETDFWLLISQMLMDFHNFNFEWSLMPLATILILGHMTRIEASDWLRAKTGVIQPNGAQFSKFQLWVVPEAIGHHLGMPVT